MARRCCISPLALDREISPCRREVFGPRTPGSLHPPPPVPSASFTTSGFKVVDRIRRTQIRKGNRRIRRPQGTVSAGKEAPRRGTLRSSNAEEGKRHPHRYHRPRRPPQSAAGRKLHSSYTIYTRDSRLPQPPAAGAAAGGRGTRQIDGGEVDLGRVEKIASQHCAGREERSKVILATKISGYSDRTFLRDNAEVVRVDAANIKESVEKSLSRLSTDYIDLLHIHWPDRYVALYGEFSYDSTKWRPSVPFEDQLKALQELIDEGKVRYIGVSNETSYGVMQFVQAAKLQGFPKIVSIENGYSLLVRCSFEVDLVEICHPNNCNVGLLAYSPLASGALTGKYLDASSDNAFPGYMQRYNSLLAQEATKEYIKVAKKHGLTPVQLALGFVRDRPFTASTIIGATTMDQLRENIDAFTSAPRPLPPQVHDDIETVFKRYRDPAVL